MIWQRRVLVFGLVLGFGLLLVDRWRLGRALDVLKAQAAAERSAVQSDLDAARNAAFWKERELDRDAHRERKRADAEAAELRQRVEDLEAARWLK